MPYERGGHVSPCSEDCSSCYYGKLCENFYEPPKTSYVSNFERLGNKINELVNSYYSASYNVRRLYKYFYCDKFLTSSDYTKKDDFFISGGLSPENLQTQLEKLPQEKREKIRKFCRAVYYLKISDLLNIFNRDDEGCLFSMNAVAAINNGVYKTKENGKTVYSAKEAEIKRRWSLAQNEKVSSIINEKASDKNSL